MESNNSDLRESMFFTARKARVPCNTEELTGSSSSSNPASSPYVYPRHIHSMMKRLSNSEMSLEDTEIESSKDHWTEDVESKYYTAASNVDVDSSTSKSEAVSVVEGSTEMDRLQLFEENVEVIRSLQRQNPESDFLGYRDEVVLGRKIAEGGQGVFEDSEDSGPTLVDDVLHGKRPKLPSHLSPWMEELLSKCWHMDLLRRQLFKK